MKKTILIAVAALVMASGPAMAAGHAGEAHDAKCLKDCQMMVRNCGQEVDSLPQRISRLKAEIAKGSATYDEAELNALSRKLKEAEKLLHNINFEG